MDVLAVKVNGSDIKPGISLITPWCFNIQTSQGFKNFCILSSNNTYSVYNEVMYFQYVYNSVYSTDLKNRTRSSNLHSENEAGSNLIIIRDLFSSGSKMTRSKSAILDSGLA